MIKASELRIGNLVIYKPYGNQDGDIVTVHGIWGMKAYFDKHSNKSGMFHNLQPIPLTPEILEKCGFEMMPIGKYKDWGNWHLEKGQHLVSYDDRTNTEGFSYNGCSLWHPTTSLHQLQNLYFALTGEELEVKL